MTRHGGWWTRHYEANKRAGMIFIFSLPCRPHGSNSLLTWDTAGVFCTEYSDLKGPEKGDAVKFWLWLTQGLIFLNVSPLHSHLPGEPPCQEGRPARRAGGVHVVIGENDAGPPDWKIILFSPQVSRPQPTLHALPDVLPGSRGCSRTHRSNLGGRNFVIIISRSWRSSVFSGSPRSSMTIIMMWGGTSLFFSVNSP